MVKIVLCTTVLMGLIPALCFGSEALPVIDEVETLHLVKEKHQISTRIDTGAHQMNETKDTKR